MGTFDREPTKVVERRSIWRRQFLGWRLDYYIFDGTEWFIDRGATRSFAPFDGVVPSVEECREAQERHTEASQAP